MPKSEYHIDMDVRFDPDKESLEKIDKVFDNYKRIKLFDNDEDLEKAKRVFTEFEIRRSSIKNAMQMLNQYRSGIGADDSYTDQNTEALEEYMRKLAGNNKQLQELFEKNNEQLENWQSVFVGNMKTIVVAKLASIAKSFLQGIADIFKEAWQELDKIVKSGLLTDPTTRQNAFEYGMSASESYGFEQAKSMLGIHDEEDLWYMNDFQREKFQEIMTKYAEKYQRLYDSGFFEKYLEFQIEMQEFQQDLKLELVQFFMDNKETIKTFMRLGIKTMEFIIDSLGRLVESLDPDGSTGDAERAADIDSVISTYQNRTQTNNVNINTNANFTGTTDAQKDYYMNMMSAANTEAKRYFGG